MTHDQIQTGLKALSKKLQLEKDPDNILVMEAMCEIQDLQTKFDDIQDRYVKLLKNCRELSEKLVETGNERLIHPDWLDPNWQIGYIAGVSDAITMIEQKEVNE